jgi:hypothetical protein
MHSQPRVVTVTPKPTKVSTQWPSVTLWSENIMLGLPERNGLLFGDWNSYTRSNDGCAMTKVVMTEFSSSQVTSQWYPVVSIMPDWNGGLCCWWTCVKNERMLATRVVLTWCTLGKSFCQSDHLNPGDVCLVSERGMHGGTCLLN